MARILEGLSPADYHRDPCEHPSLSSSIAHVLISESPEKAFHRHPRLGHGSVVSTAEQDSGSVVHALTMGVDDRVVVIEAPDFRTKIAREQRDAALAAQLLPVTRPFYDEHRKIVEILRAKLLALGFDFTGRSEVAIEWEDEGVLCRSMLDHVFLETGQWWDLKTAADARAHRISRSFVSFGYDLQEHAYTKAVEALRPELVGRVEGTFLFVELEPPYAVNVVQPTGMMRELGRVRWERARELWRDCLTTGHWPGYADGVVRVDPPAYAVAEYLSGGRP